MSSTLEQTLRQINAEYAKKHKLPDDAPPRISLGSDLPLPVFISTGNPALDLALGGGLPEGTIFEIFGKPGSSKTVTMSYIMAQVQKLGKYVIYYHTEETGPPLAAWKLAGVDESKVVYLASRNYGEDGINIVRKLLFPAGSVLPDPSIGLIAIDSLSAVSPKAEVDSVDENGAESVTMARLAAMTSKLFRDICTTGWTANKCLFGFISQERTQIGTYGAPTEATGGLAPKYYAKIRINLRSGGKADRITEGDEIIGNTVHFSIVKNNTGEPPYRQGSWTYKYHVGIDVNGAVLAEARQMGLITQAGRTYTIRWVENGEVKQLTVVGQKNIEDRLVSTNAMEPLTSFIKELRDFSAAKSIDYVDGIALLDGEPINIIEEFLASNDVTASTEDYKPIY